MAMSYHAISSAFTHRPVSVWGAAANPAPATDAETRPYGYAGRVTCSPWEGLYLEETPMVDVKEDGAVQAGTELERFLTNLMCGE